MGGYDSCRMPTAKASAIDAIFPAQTLPLELFPTLCWRELWLQNYFPASELFRDLEYANIGSDFSPTFPDVLIAHAAGMHEEHFFETDAASKVAPTVSLSGA